jgi:hypothetical protein
MTTYQSGHEIREGDVVSLSTHAHYAFVERIGDGRVLVQFNNGTGYDAELDTLSLIARSTQPESAP